MLVGGTSLSYRWYEQVRWHRYNREVAGDRRQEKPSFAAQIAVQYVMLVLEPTVYLLKINGESYITDVPVL